VTEILALAHAWPVFVVLLVFGLLPGVVVRLLSLGYRPDDPRRQEMIAEVYAVPRWERPFWALEQVERVVSEGIWERVVDVADGWLFNRWVLGDGLERHLAAPATFEVPEASDIARLRPGDLVKLVFEPKGRLVTKDVWPERMWVQVTGASEAGFEGTLDNHPIMFNRLHYGQRIRFEARHVIDFWATEDSDEECQSRVLECSQKRSPETPGSEGGQPCH